MSIDLTVYVNMGSKWAVSQLGEQSYEVLWDSPGSAWAEILRMQEAPPARINISKRNVITIQSSKSSYCA